MKIGISGASGKLGSFAIKNAVGRGAGQIVALSPSAPTRSDAQARVADYNKPAQLVEAFRDLDSLLFVPSNEMQPLVRGQQNRAVIDAAAAAGVGHVVMISTSGIHAAPEASMTQAYWSGEQYLMRKAARWNIVRMNHFAETFTHAGATASATGKHLGLGPSRIGFVSRDDVAAAAVGILLGKGQDGAIYNATGPSALSGEERAEGLSRVYEKEIAFEQIDEDSYRAMLAAAGTPDAFIGAVIDVEASYVDGVFDIVTGDVERLAGTKPRNLEEVLREELKSMGA